MIECPALHFVADKEKIVKKETYQTEQTRKYFQRHRNKRTKKSLLIKHSVAQQSNTILKIIKNPYEIVYEDPESEIEIQETIDKETI